MLNLWLIYIRSHSLGLEHKRFEESELLKGEQIVSMLSQQYN